MAYRDSKVYFDGSHYIAIPIEPKRQRSLNKSLNEIIAVKGPPPSVIKNADDYEWISFDQDFEEVLEESGLDTIRYITYNEYFNELYKATENVPKKQRRDLLLSKMSCCFIDESKAHDFVDKKFSQKKHNLVARRVRLLRKISLQQFNYFCTFTYDSNKNSEEDFKKKLRISFRNLAYRNQWKYAGVWERSPKMKRLHFHGLFYIPPDGMVGELIEVTDYSTRQKKVQRTFQNTYFNERFGRSDFKPITDNRLLGAAMAYLVKYIEKSGERIVYSKGLPQYFITDINGNDVVCRFGYDDRKLLLFDDFSCFDNGNYIGEVSKETISKLRKTDS